MTMFVFAVAFFLVFFAIYFFRPRKKDRIVPQTLEREIPDPEEILLPHRAMPNWPATMERLDGETAEVRIASVSRGSAFIRSDVKLAIGEKFRLTILLPDHPHLQLEAEVTWSNMHLPPDKVVNRGLGIRFIAVGEETARFINETIARHAAALETAEIPPQK